MSAAIHGTFPQRSFAPGSVEELAELVRSTAAENVALTPVGSGTRLSLGNPPARYEAAVEMRGLRRVIEYHPDDQVVVAEAGMTLAELQATLAAHGQRLAADPPADDRTTLGGLIATNAYGPLALRYGTPKDLIVGIEVVRADGTLAHAGGKVVKNVAGFDVSKLMVGSLGTLAVITKATFRVHPLPQARRSVALSTSPERVFPLVLALREAQLEPSALVANTRADRMRVEIRFEGFTAGVDAQVEAASALAREFDPAPEIDSPALRYADLAGFAIKATFRPSDFGTLAAEFADAMLAWRFEMHALPANGVLRFVSEAGGLADPPFGPEGLLAARELVEALGGTFVVERMPSAWYAHLDAWGAPPASFRLMQALKARFDPNRRLNPGRFVGGL